MGFSLFTNTYVIWISFSNTGDASSWQKAVVTAKSHKGLTRQITTCWVVRDIPVSGIYKKYVAILRDAYEILTLLYFFFIISRYIIKANNSVGNLNPMSWWGPKGCALFHGRLERVLSSCTTPCIPTPDIWLPFDTAFLTKVWGRGQLKRWSSAHGKPDGRRTGALHQK